MTPLFEELQTRDSIAWDDFYRRHVCEIYGFVSRLVSDDRSAADDLFQETWLAALDAIEQYDPNRGDLRAWLFGIARRRVALYWRRRLAKQSVVESADLTEAASSGAILPDEAIVQIEEAAAVQAALLVLPEDRRRVLTEKYVEGLSVERIATRTGKSPKAVESLLSRARDELRSLLSWHFSTSTKGK